MFVCVCAELKEEMGLCSRAVFGVEPSQMSLLFFLMYSAAAGGVLKLLETTPGAAQEFKVKVIPPIHTHTHTYRTVHRFIG